MIDGSKASLLKIAQKLLGWPGVALLVVSFVALAFVLLWLLPELLTPASDDPIRRAELQNELRRTWAQVLLGLVVLGTFVVTWWRASVAEKAVEVSREQQITERFTRAIEQLGNQRSMAIRLGGIYALERIAKDSKDDHWQVMEVLTAYVWENARWDEESDEHGVQVSDDLDEHRVPADIRAIMTVLGRRRVEYDTPDRSLDLSQTDLAGANLERAHLEGVSFQRSCLKDSKLRGAHFESADFRFANLERAELIGTYLVESMFDHANLKQAFIHSAHLEKASLFKADVRGTDLSMARGLTQDQIDSAIIDEHTVLPDYLNQGQAGG